MKFLIGLLLLTSISASANCEKARKTKVLIDRIEAYNVVIKQGFVNNDLLEAKQLIAEGKYCSNGFAALSLCTGIVTEHAYFGGLKAENEKDQYRLEKALYEFGKLFSAPTSNSFGCNLTELNFPAL